MAWFSAGLVTQVIQFWQTKRYLKMVGQAFTPSEIHFFNAYRLHTYRVGVTTDIDLSDEEISVNHWGSTFEAFANEWPEVVQRLTSD